jgi:hypothetical protein
MAVAHPHVRTAVAALFAAMLVTLGLALSVPAVAAPGDVYLADESGGPSSSDGAIFKFGASGGAPSVVAENTALDQPSGMLLDPVTGLLLVADYTPTIHTVDRATGAIGTYATGPADADFVDLVVAPSGQIYATDNHNDVVYRIDPATKAVVPVASGFFVPSSDSLAGIAASRAGKLYVTDWSGIVYEIDAGTGAARVFAHDPLISGADGLAFGPDERFLYVAGFCRPVLDCGDNSNPPNQLAKIEMATGAVSTVASLSDAVAVSLRTDGSFLVSNTEDRVVQTVGASGAPVGNFTTVGAPLEYPHDTVTEPALCAGKVPTVVGTTGSDTLTGSPFADVISTLGGKDRVKARGGNDVVCGGPGKDKIFGQAGRDRLFGQAGKDTLFGGKSKDRVLGGKGRDVLRCTPIDPRCK